MDSYMRWNVTLAKRPDNVAEAKNTIAVLKERRVIGHIPFHLANTKNHTSIITHFTSKPPNSQE